VQIAPKEQIGMHQQNTWELSWIIIGSGMRIIGDTTEEFTSGEVVLIPPEIPHCWYFDNEITDKKGKIANVSLFWGNDFLNICSNCFPELHEHCQKINELTNAIRFSGEKLDIIISILKKMQQENEIKRIASIIELIITIAEDEDSQCIVGKYQKMDKKKRRLDQIQIFVICNIKRHITLLDIARHVGMNRASFCVFFKKATGKTFINYLNEYRIELACQLLKESKNNIADICYETGFNDIPYFNRTFKRLKKVSPTKYRRNATTA
jgi:AraC-like DNA-binding protein